ncbi:uncharacterized protein LOC134524132 [Chroicocephalus ridibundus]|uniref:uncharacterized protein LOC134524132 n=1 Tax=Chroicocephalus ridibundus TaxID=1192867 RepID=UPI002FDCA0FA
MVPFPVSPGYGLLVLPGLSWALVHGAPGCLGDPGADPVFPGPVFLSGMVTLHFFPLFFFQLYHHGVGGTGVSPGCPPGVGGQGVVRELQCHHGACPPGCPCPIPVPCPRGTRVSGCCGVGVPTSLLGLPMLVLIPTPIVPIFLWDPARLSPGWSSPVGLGSAGAGGCFWGWAVARADSLPFFLFPFPAATKSPQWRCRRPLLTLLLPSGGAGCARGEPWMWSGLIGCGCCGGLVFAPNLLLSALGCLHCPVPEHHLVQELRPIPFPAWPALVWRRQLGCAGGPSPRRAKGSRSRPKSLPGAGGGVGRAGDSGAPLGPCKAQRGPRGARARPVRKVCDRQLATGGRSQHSSVILLFFFFLTTLFTL